MKRVYFHIDEFNRDSMVASALKKELKKNNVELIYGNRFTTNKILKFFIKDFDLFIFPRIGFFKKFKRQKIKNIFLLFTEALGTFNNENNKTYLEATFFGSDFVSGNKEYFKMINLNLLWGPKVYSYIKKNYPEILDKFYIVGHPRYDSIFTKNILKKNKKIKIGIITGQLILNDFQNRKPIEIITNRLKSKDKYIFYNKKLNKKLLSDPQNIIDQTFRELKQIDLIIKLIDLLSKIDNVEIYIKFHPLENNNFWLNYFKKHYNNLNLPKHTSIPFTVWAKKLDYIIGHASTTFYDAISVDTIPISLEEMIGYNENDFYNNEDKSEIMKYVLRPKNFQEIEDIIINKKNLNKYKNQIDKVMYDEAYFPNSKNSIFLITEKIIEFLDINKNHKLSFYKFIKILIFKLLNFYLSYLAAIFRFMRNKENSSSSFLLTLKNIKHINNIIKNE